MSRPVIEPGIYFGLPDDVYHAADGLSASGMKELAVSPLRYWHRFLNSEAEKPEESPALRFGKAVHCRMLEPDRFKEQYVSQPSPEDFPGCLVTVDDLKKWLAERGLPDTAKRKDDLIARVQGTGKHPPIWDVEKARIAEMSEGKTALSHKEFASVERLASVMLADQFVAAALTGGCAEVSFFVRDPETGVMLKARMDYVKPESTIDLKSFSNSRGKPTDRAVNEAIYYEGYYLQCVFYNQVREHARQAMLSGEIQTHGLVDEAWIDAFCQCDRHGFGFIFVESVEPHEMRSIQSLNSEYAGADANVYWTTAAMRIAEMTALYARCIERFGDEPWREPQRLCILMDTDLPQLIFM